ncbi:unnamed protein product [Moneuplotes crassus]|uniref:Uncharacterized protein n=1 Tax=Euplotes crassus TaxID=5936 RepID=A0AAD1XD19_EUPCR|nr:unnamed protein product [Moneuplotes crassus]
MSSFTGTCFGIEARFMLFQVSSISPFLLKIFLNGELAFALSFQEAYLLVPLKSRFGLSDLGFSLSEAFLCKTKCCRSCFISLEMFPFLPEVCIMSECLFSGSFFQSILGKKGRKEDTLFVFDILKKETSSLTKLRLASFFPQKDLLGGEKSVLLSWSTTFPLSFKGLCPIFPSVESFLSACIFLVQTWLGVSDTSSQSQINSCFSQKLRESILIIF